MSINRVVLVTGMSGAGRTRCLKILEDIGFEAVDNLPMFLLSRVLRPDKLSPVAIAIGIDSRTRNFEPQSLVAELEQSRSDGAISVTLLYLECDDEVLRRRFTKTRRRHPLADATNVAEALSRERELMMPLKMAADLVIDTSDLSIPQLRHLITGYFGRDGSKLLISVLSFSYALGLPREADLVFDVRFLRNPHYVATLEPQTGLSPAVQAHVQSDPDFPEFACYLKKLFGLLPSRFHDEGKTYLTIAFGCTGGKHRSVYMAELVSSWLRNDGWEVTTTHRDMPRSAEQAVT